MRAAKIKPKQFPASGSTQFATKRRTRGKNAGKLVEVYFILFYHFVFLYKHFRVIIFSA